MNKRYVQITYKQTGKVYTFPTVTKMYSVLGENGIGIKINSLWNAVSKNDGIYENDNVKIEYKVTHRIKW